MTPTLQAFVITLREGLEAFLIVAISLAYLRKGGWHSLGRAVYLGVAGGLAVSAVGGYLLYNASNQEFLDGRWPSSPPSRWRGWSATCGATAGR
jgi:high-affinity iron transporter